MKVADAIAQILKAEGVEFLFAYPVNHLIEAAAKVDIGVPLIVTLQGKNAEEGQQILQDSGLELETAILFREAAEKVTAALARSELA